MNKLVSKNLVQRFKEGRKIVKAKWGDAAPYPLPLHDENKNPYVGMWYTSEDNKPVGTALIYNTEQVRQRDLENPFYESAYLVNTPYYQTLSNNKYKGPRDFVNSYEKTGGHPTIDKKALPKGNSYTLNSTGKRTSLVNNRWVNGIKRRNEITDVRATQQMLKDAGFNIGKFGVDGKWGKDTEAAYQKYLSLKNIPTYEKPEIPSVAAMAGIYSEENKPLYQRIRFKQGGQLVSKNPIQRFKQGGIQKFQNAGNLPTAPKAEDRYKDSYKSWDWPQFKEVTAGSILFPGAKISQTIEDSDTTYMETPSRFPFVKVVPRVAKNNAKTIEWRDLITGQTYPEVKRGNSREYEILKRRFNTAWNLAK